MSKATVIAEAIWRSTRMPIAIFMIMVPFVMERPLIMEQPWGWVGTFFALFIINAGVSILMDHLADLVATKMVEKLNAQRSPY